MSQWELPDSIFAVVKAAKGIGNLARACGIGVQNIYRWKRVPEHHLETIWQLFHIHPMTLRPDVFDPERLKRKAEIQFKKEAKIAAGPRKRIKYKPGRKRPETVDMRWLR